MERGRGGGGGGGEGGDGDGLLQLVWICATVQSDRALCHGNIFMSNIHMTLLAKIFMFLQCLFRANIQTQILDSLFDKQKYQD